MMLATIIALVLVTVPGRVTNTSTSNSQLFYVLMDYGMRVFHAGKDFFELKNPIRVGGVKLQKIRIHNLKSIHEVKLSEIKAILMEESKTKEWKVTTRCFSIDRNIGLQQMTVGAESKLKVFFKTKGSEYATHSGQENLSTSDRNGTREPFHALKLRGPFAKLEGMAD